MELQFKDRKDYLKYLDSKLPDEYVSKRSVPTGQHKYYSTVIQEKVADNIFYQWHVIDEHFQMVGDQLICTVKLEYIPSYPDAEISICTGSSATLLTGPKNSAEYGVPKARKTAIGNALEQLGNVFGSSLGRKAFGKEVPADFTFRKYEEEVNDGDSN